MDEMNWKCFKCGVPLANKAVVFEYMNRSFSHEVPVCPKCGPGVFLADHKDRLSCAKCGYTEPKQ